MRFAVRVPEPLPFQLLRNAPHRFQQDIRRRQILLQILRRAEAHRLLVALDIVHAAQYDEAGFRCRVLHAPNHLQSVDPRHDDIHDRNVGLFPQDQFNSLFPAACFAGNDKLTLLPWNDRLHTDQVKRLIINQYKLHHSAFPPFPFSAAAADTRAYSAPAHFQS